MESNTIYKRQSKLIGVFEKDLKYIYVNGEIKSNNDLLFSTINDIESKINNSFLSNKYKSLLKEKLYFVLCYGDVFKKDNLLMTKISFDNNMEYIFKLKINDLNIESSSVFKSEKGVIVTSVNAFFENELNYINYEEKIINKCNLKSIKNLSTYECYSDDLIFGNYKEEDLTYKGKNKGLVLKEECTLFKDDNKVYKKSSSGIRNIDIKSYKDEDFSYDNNSFYLIYDDVCKKICKEDYLGVINNIKNKSKVR